MAGQGQGAGGAGWPRRLRAQGGAEGGAAAAQRARLDQVARGAGNLRQLLHVSQAAAGLECRQRCGEHVLQGGELTLRTRGRASAGLSTQAWRQVLGATDRQAAESGWRRACLECLRNKRNHAP